MSDAQLIGALKAACVRMFEHRHDLKRAQTLLRIWPEGLVLECKIPASKPEDIAGSSMRTVTWDELSGLTPARAIEIVDEVCGPARTLLLGQ
ncbi:MAG TPA: hypothetical protein VKX28_26735 [Xanthobacteraceae bacterium]|nr:hypothetical protein [Xanthobacteraceae bacterium]